MQKRSQRTLARILNAARSCVAEMGLEKTTFEAVAKRAGINQALVVYHLKSRPQIFVMIMQDWLDKSLVQTETAIQAHSSGAEMLRAYVRVSMEAFRGDPEYPKIYIAFYYLSSFDPTYVQMNEQLKLEASERILGILSVGLAQGIFKISNPRLVAKLIHVYITGLLLNLASEKPRFSDVEFVSQIEIDCLKMAGWVGPIIP